MLSLTLSIVKRAVYPSWFKVLTSMVRAGVFGHAKGGAVVSKSSSDYVNKKAYIPRHPLTPPSRRRAVVLQHRSGRQIGDWTSHLDVSPPLKSRGVGLPRGPLGTTRNTAQNPSTQRG